ncbi:hypothetical protein AB5N19_05808 [Seiridium cardinale]|uniref:Uncharacterized protein n=1 Tax=Seiridium cardinale TaxID=138064 RepID=A0ABR2XH81_9PEZI
MAQQIVLPWPVGFMSPDNLLAIPNDLQRSRLLRFLQNLRNHDLPNHQDLVEALNFYTARNGAVVNAGLHSYTHFKVLDVPRATQPLPCNINVLLPADVARDLSVPWTPISTSEVRNAANGCAKYRFFFFIYRHRPTMTYNANLAVNRDDPDIIYTMSYFDREHPRRMTWLDFKDEPQGDRGNRLRDIQRFWAKAQVNPQGVSRSWFVDPKWYGNIVGHAYTQPLTTNYAWGALEQVSAGKIRKPFTLYSVMAAIVFLTNNIYGLPDWPAGVALPTPQIPDNFDQVTGMQARLIPELICCTLHLLRVNHNAAFNDTIVRNGAEGPVPAPGGFGLLDQKWVEYHLKLSQHPTLRFYRHRLQKALTNDPRRLAALGVASNANQFPAWYEDRLV